MTIPFFEDELVIMYECSDNSTECSREKLINNLAKKIDVNNSNDFTDVNVCFRLLGKLSLITQLDLELLLKRAKSAYKYNAELEENNEKDSCKFGDFQCTTCEYKRNCDAKPTIFRDIDFCDAICVFSRPLE